MTDTPPKTFISYSWSSPDHELWVVDLATTLMESGVDVVLDKWDLREGEEASAFMERMVTDPSVTRVVIISDKAYAEKSDQRKGGAGTEAQIISKRIFDDADPGKFVVACRELNDDGKHIVPAYYTSRIFIDFTDDTRRSDSVEQLIRWLYDKPAYKKPALGKAPHYIADDKNSVQLPTGAAARRANDAIVNARPFAYGATNEYFNIFADSLEAFRLPAEADLLCDIVTERLDDMVPYRNEMLDVVKNICIYTDDQRYGELLHGFFEKVLQYYYPPVGVSRWNEAELDIFRYFGWEAFLHVASQIFHSRRADLFQALTYSPYVCDRAPHFSRQSIDVYDIFNRQFKLFQYRNQKKGIRRYEPEADLIKERADMSPNTFDQIMEVDFLLYLRGRLTGAMWHPRTLVYSSSRWAQPFPSFVRSQSKREFEKLKVFLGISDKSALDEFMSFVAKGNGWVPRWDFDRLDPSLLANHEKLCTSP